MLKLNIISGTIIKENMVDEKFKITYNKTTNVYGIIDTETGRILELDNKYHVKQLVDLLNDWRLIIKDKWGLK